MDLIKFSAKVCDYVMMTSSVNSSAGDVVMTSSVNSSAGVVMMTSSVNSSAGDVVMTSSVNSSAGVVMMTSSVNRVAGDVLLYFAQDCYVVVQKTTMAMMDRLRKVLELDVGSCIYLTGNFV